MEEEKNMQPNAPVEDDDEFVDVASEKAQAEREAAEAEKKEKANIAKKEAADKAQADAEKVESADTSALRLAEDLQGGAVEQVVPADQKGFFQYSDENLKKIEDARKKWVSDYRVGSIIKVGISMFCLMAIIVGWIVPTTVLGNNAGQIPLYIALGIAGASLVIMFVTSFLIKKRGNKLISAYFHGFYEPFDAYAFNGLPITNVQGDVDAKITKEEFEGGKAFRATHSVGSRDALTFLYKDVDAALADAASQEERKQRGLVTTFVGKFLRMHNNLPISEDGLLIYIKGNDRAIPPTGIVGETPLKETPRYNIYGSNKDLKWLNADVMKMIEDIHTDKLLVDVTISIQKGRTYIYMGLEDTIMILPNKEPFNPNYLIAYKKVLGDFLELGYALRK